MDMDRSLTLASDQASPGPALWGWQTQARVSGVSGTRLVTEINNLEQTEQSGLLDKRLNDVLSYLFFLFIGDAVVREYPEANKNNKCLISDFLAMLLLKLMMFKVRFLITVYLVCCDLR